MNNGKFKIELTEAEILEIIKKDKTLQEQILKTIEASSKEDIAIEYLEGLSPEEYCKVVANTAYDPYQKAKKNLMDTSFKEHDSWDEVMVCLFNTVKFTSY